MLFVWPWLILPGLCEAQFSEFSIKPCEAGEAEAGVQVLWPRRGQRLAPTLTPTKIRTRIWGDFSLRKDGYILAVVAGVDQSHVSEVNEVIDTLVSAYMNIEVFGLQPGQYFAQVVLVDNTGKSRTCWRTHEVSFSIARRQDEQNRSAALHRNLILYEQGYKYNAAIQDSEQFLVQPKDPSRDFAYVTILWSDDFVDNAIVWATGLRAVGSTFRRICMIGRNRIARSRIQILARCCCEIAITDPIQAPALSRSSWSQYALVLTKLRIFQLDRKGLKKIVMMDADTLVLQNIDELFWLPSPSVTVDKDTLMGETKKPKLSAGIMVLEPDSAKFDRLMEDSNLVLDEKKNKKLHFIEQDLLNAFFNHNYNILPMTYNLYPELLDLLPFLHVSQDSGVNSSMWPSMELPLDNSIKVVHFWHLFNPFQITKYKGAHNLQVNAKRIHKQMWRWYTIFWKLHQEGLKRGAPEDYPKWVQKCYHSSRAFGTEQQKFVPVAWGAHCRHIDGVAW
ncbi:unnamed protein product [Durusdinium trenchii]|uniref:Hexosyltransferase n=2 Tax=Durusdinium trenchii TaxID=1381693 RepID=A0ABP0RA96_9DINO